ncbi:Tetratricopeptide repeat-containing protein [Tistlia consotensis]|uniref:Tetratricopeptide repeat-containing protein n=1 Tax=Tistlia consotensis USBA 355 TaxID=560819 RepID=A0A1Y6BHR3_9PROT|nr:adenylate/guanylate cyclase domain-containing protein [Tistlia consotensis]SMF12114.1 Tetratricopeptide repeat-containing protein [Tistlia consotensis USBA 355]SNR51352.1 Tetratricopeptide repeat-containing protein [Tistlia consotensis]
MTDVKRWLDGVGLGKHASVFAANDIGFDVLPELAEDDLKELGLSLGDRKRLLAAIRRLGDAPSEASPPREPAPDPPPAAAPGTRRQVTILFADLSGFTELSGRLDAEEVHALLQRYFAAVDETLHAFGGAIDKHIGDAVMAVFGAPLAHSDDPERAVRAALEIHRRLALFEPPLTGHIGIASGQVVANRTGSDSFAEYTVTGASVNLAARLQDRAGAGETLISEAVWSSVRTISEADPVGRVAIKGIAEPVEVWRLAGLRDRPEGVAGRPMVGRRRELRQLAAILAECLAEKAGQLVRVRGEPGIGKTRLIDAFQGEAQAAGVACHSGLVLDFGAGKGRDAVPALVRSLLDIPLGSGKAVRRAAAERGVETGLVEAADLVHLNGLLDLPQPPALKALYDAMDNRTRQEGRAQTLASLVVAAGRRSPVLLRIEDIHWADAELLGQLGAIAARIPDGTIAMVMTTRIEGDPIDVAWRALVRDCPFTTIDLGPLRPEDAMALAGQYAAASAETARACIERAAGNPLFLDQLLQNAFESGAAGVPGSVQSIVQSRMDKLAPVDRDALQAAAVFGQRFTAAAVAHALGLEAYDCAVLLAQNLVRPEGDQLLFVHALVRDGVYETLLRDRRQALHRRAADWYAASDAVLRARHLEAAGDPGAAAAYLAAAEEQLAAYRYDRALGLVEAARALGGPTEVRFALLCLEGELRRMLAESERSLACFGEALDLAATPEQECDARIGLAAGMRILDRFDAAFAELDRATTLAGALERPDRAAQVAYLRGNLLFPLGRTEECRAAHEEALALGRAAGSARLEVQALGGLGDANYVSGRIRSAHRHFEDCVAQARAHDFGAILVANAPMLAWTAILVGDFASGSASAEAALQAAEQAGNDRAAIIVYNALAFLETARGRLDAAARHAEEIVRLSERLGSARFGSYGLNHLADLCMAQGARTAARAHSARAKALAEGPAFGFCGPWILATSARLAESAEAARADLERGEAALGAGAVAHNHFFFRHEALQYCLDNGDLEGVERHARAFEAYLGGETTDWTDYVVGRARALAAVAGGRRDEALRADLERCLGFAESRQLGPSAEAIRAALQLLA